MLCLMIVQKNTEGMTRFQNHHIKRKSVQGKEANPLKIEKIVTKRKRNVTNLVERGVCQETEVILMSLGGVSLRRKGRDIHLVRKHDVQEVGATLGKIEDIQEKKEKRILQKEDAIDQRKGLLLQRIEGVVPEKKEGKAHHQIRRGGGQEREVIQEKVEVILGMAERSILWRESETVQGTGTGVTHRMTEEVILGRGEEEVHQKEKEGDLKKEATLGNMIGDILEKRGLGIHQRGKEENQGIEVILGNHEKDTLHRERKGGQEKGASLVDLRGVGLEKRGRSIQNERNRRDGDQKEAEAPPGVHGPLPLILN